MFVCLVFIVISYSCFHLYWCQNPIFTYVYSEPIKTFEFEFVQVGKITVFDLASKVNNIGQRFYIHT